MNLPVATSSAFFLDLAARYRKDPYSVPADWRLHFEALGEASAARAPADGAARQLVAAYRAHGHRASALDPLGLAPRETARAVSEARAALEDADGVPLSATVGGRPAASAAELIDQLERVYAGTLALEAKHVDDEDARAWLYETYEATLLTDTEASVAEQALLSIALADGFETFVKTKFPSKKRFGVEGAESAIVFLRALLARACRSGLKETVIGGMHRGRLATLAVVLGKPVGVLLAEIKGRDMTGGGPGLTGDVPYHLGYGGEIVEGERRMQVSLAPHPSHLMTVAPVVMGLARARRGLRADDAMCLLLHTDAAFAGQGLTSEILQLGGLQGYEVGGTIHLVVNNQIGFTTLPSEARTSRYCTDAAKAVGAPVLHVNGDDPLAVMRAVSVAFAWRSHTGRDILVDLVCYRRNGHNELDEPRFTQPRLWAAIDGRRSLKETFAEQVTQLDAAAVARVEAEAERFRLEMQAGYDAIATLRPNASAGVQPDWADVPRATAQDMARPVETGLAEEELRRIGLEASTVPDDLAPHAKVAQFYQKRRESLSQGRDINLATAEALAFASLLAEGVSVRLSGQDSVRGTFTQRHLAVHDLETGVARMPLAAAARDKARFEAINSPLTEYGVLGFEYGHSLADPGALTVWEAQFGDFLNGAQIVADQFVVSAEGKWDMKSGLVVLLPHGLEGQGPDHSSARVERLLQLAVDGNIIVANPSTPANLFHLLRRQMVAPWRKPLFVIAPKSLLRLKECLSTLEEMAAGTRFRPVIAEPVRRDAKRVVLCSGKVFYDLARARAAHGLEEDVALVRLEQLHPFPHAELAEALAPYGAAEWVWCQEEPENQGARAHVAEVLAPRLAAHAGPWRMVARPAMPVAAGGSIEQHEIEQALLVRRALGLEDAAG